LKKFDSEVFYNKKVAQNDLEKLFNEKPK